MLSEDKETQNGQLTSSDPEAIRHLEAAIHAGKHWYLALLESISLWDLAEETIDDRDYRYLISGEAFDWLLLAERLCRSVSHLLPEDEMTAFLFNGEPPVNLPPEKFKELIGEIKYHQYLNFFYGVTVEEALLLAVGDEVRKERWASGYHREKDNTSEIYRRIYGASKVALLKHFRKERGYPQLQSISLSELKEFTYWLFKHRLKHSDKAKIASDTRKGLDWLKGKVFNRWLDRRAFELDYIDIMPDTE